MPISEDFLEKLDKSIARLGDDPSGHPVRESSTSEESLIRTYAPKHMEQPFQELYSILYPCLRPREFDNEDVSTASAILMGPRGSGKSLLAHRCLEACREAHKSKFHKVEVNGIVVRGEDVPSVVYEIIRQLSDIALKKQTKDNISNVAGADNTLEERNSSNGDSSANAGRRKRGRKNRDEHILRLRKSTFASNLALLESTLNMAEVDRIPIVLILDELDAFILQAKEAQQARQLLLYYLLDRVATPGSNLTLIGMTSNFTAFSHMEKRIRSRAEGTSKIVYVRPPNTFDQLVSILADKISDCPIKTDLMQYLSTASSDDKETQRIACTFRREFNMGRDVRWFCSVIASSLSLYRFDCLLAETDNKIAFEMDHIVQSLVMAGSLCLSDAPAASATKQPSLNIVDGIAIDPRLQASLLDLSPPQVALLFAAKRILTRDAQLENPNSLENGGAPLTLERIFQEYRSFRRSLQSSDDEILMLAARQLLERGVLIPSIDHSGGGPLQYHLSLSYESLDPYSISRLALHLPMDLHRELEEALQSNIIECSTALQEWGRKNN